jgi:hypothetical protein
MTDWQNLETPIRNLNASGKKYYVIGDYKKHGQRRLYATKIDYNQVKQGDLVFPAGAGGINFKNLPASNHVRGFKTPTTFGLGELRVYDLSKGFGRGLNYESTQMQYDPLGNPIGQADMTSIPATVLYGVIRKTTPDDAGSVNFEEGMEKMNGGCPIDIDVDENNDGKTDYTVRHQGNRICK